MYVYEKNKNENYRISNEKFTTLYTNNDSINFFRYYGISENGDLYTIYLQEADIQKIKVEKIATNLKVRGILSDGDGNLPVCLQHRIVIEINWRKSN